MSKYSDCLDLKPWYSGKSGHIAIMKLIKVKAQLNSPKLLGVTFPFFVFGLFYTFFWFFLFVCFIIRIVIIVTYPLYLFLLLLLWLLPTLSFLIPYTLQFLYSNIRVEWNWSISIFFVVIQTGQSEGGDGELHPEVHSSDTRVWHPWVRANKNCYGRHQFIPGIWKNAGKNVTPFS